MGTVNTNSISPSRWLAKKTARFAIGGGSLPAVAVGQLDPRPCVRVLTYHRFEDELRSPFSVDPRVFEHQMRWLREAGLAASPDKVEALLAGRVDREKSVLVTMDDGDPSVHRHAFRTLTQHRIPAIAFVIAGKIGGREHMSAAELRELADAGVTIGSHSMTHRSMPSLSDRELAAEVEDSKKVLEDVIGKSVDAFAYPYGTRRDFDARCGAALKRAGYALAFTSQHGPVRIGADPFFLPRVKVESGDPDWLFRAACSGALDAWRIVDATLSWTQRAQSPTS